MALKIWQEKTSPIIEIGGQKIEVKPLTLENSLRLVLLLGPGITRLEDKWPRLTAALESTNGKRAGLLETLFVELRNELVLFPGDLVTAFALCLDRDVEWIARNATARDIVAAWPVLDAVNNFSELWQACKHLGIVVKYGR